ncbi:MAG: 3-isopropylmalate dehydratase small subunit [Candidatus Lokiarchaeota archaeon]|nr:3-isopropylmalate dehydratase small subunit [Candidatus Lokiarchaeota archaeon]
MGKFQTQGGFRVSSFEPISGRAWIFGDDIDTDQIIQGQYLTLLDYKEMAKHTLQIPRPEFVKLVKDGDVIVAGKNFGGGSSREEAPRVITEVGIRAVIAESFARIFYRNAFNLGLPAIEIPGILEFIDDGDTVQIDIDRGLLTIPSKQKQFRTPPFPKIVKEILIAGGAIEWFRNQSNRSC